MKCVCNCNETKTFEILKKKGLGYFNVYFGNVEGLIFGCSKVEFREKKNVRYTWRGKKA